MQIPPDTELFGAQKDDDFDSSMMVWRAGVHRATKGGGATKPGCSVFLDEFKKPHAHSLQVEDTWKTLRAFKKTFRAFEKDFPRVREVFPRVRELFPRVRKVAEELFGSLGPPEGVQKVSKSCATDFRELDRLARSRNENKRAFHSLLLMFLFQSRTTFGPKV